MRQTQIIGLPQEAIDFLKKENVFEKGIIYDSTTGVMAGMFDDGPELKEYSLKNGKIIQEYVQSVPWSSGPMIFLGLREKEGEVLFSWHKEIFFAL